MNLAEAFDYILLEVADSETETAGVPFLLLILRDGNLVAFKSATPPTPLTERFKTPVVKLFLQDLAFFLTCDAETQIEWFSDLASLSVGELRTALVGRATWDEMEEAVDAHLASPWIRSVVSCTPGPDWWS